ncbi:MAG TPA: hypothetical protein VKI44_38440 [Acetobacteraceae bacterium]|nr:hypothetical protein [Acetobacteraceae bacterium]
MEPVSGDVLVLTGHWCKVIEEPNVDCSKPGIYRWRIEEAGTYIGKYTKIRRPKKEYRRNVARILKGLRSHHPNGKFRRIHHALADAVRDGRCITLTIVTNCTRSELNQVEQDFIRREQPNLNASPGRRPAALMR